ncbi:hypothetical protein CNMCM5878_006711 [Aspergillus fumigatiaffinis]|nr:hypothetical protein CNMCM6457_004733 [Aspergillus fumigatiaffinis]KAF4222116.1 hypothetical protein CNMCM5878_006711 [Aspergillus fumigatiaffinis]
METYIGHVPAPADANILFEACRIGLLPRVQRRLSEKERRSIRCGSVFVWDEREAGMRRWTDGKSWGPSRVSGGFLTYRELAGKRRGGYKLDGLMKHHADPALRYVRPQEGLYPESTINDQLSPTVVTRSPLAGATYSFPPMSATRSGATLPQSYTLPYACPPTPLGTPHTITPLNSSYLSVVSAPNSLAVAYGESSLHHHLVLPSPSPQHGLPLSYLRPVHPAHAAKSSSPPAIPASATQQIPLPVPIQYSPHVPRETRDDHQRSSPDYLTPSVVPRIQSPRMRALQTSFPRVDPASSDKSGKTAHSNSNNTSRASANRVPSIGMLISILK